VSLFPLIFYLPSLSTSFLLFPFPERGRNSLRDLKSCKIPKFLIMIIIPILRLASECAPKEHFSSKFAQSFICREILLTISGIWSTYITLLDLMVNLASANANSCTVRPGISEQLYMRLIEVSYDSLRSVSLLPIMRRSCCTKFCLIKLGPFARGDTSTAISPLQPDERSNGPSSFLRWVLNVDSDHYR